MRKYTSVAAVIIIFLSGCMIFQGRADREDLQERYPLVYKAAQVDETLVYDLLQYITLLDRSRKIKSEDQIKEILTLRDSLIIQPLNMSLKKEYKDRQIPPQLHQELKALGLYPVNLKNNYVALGPATILQDKVERYASDPYKLYLQFQNYDAQSQGKKYPYLEMEPEINLLVIGAALQELYPDSEYYQMIRPRYEEVVVNFSDFHLLDGMEMETYLVGDTHFEYWPYTTDLSVRKDLVRNHQNLEIAQAINNLLSAPSALHTEDSVLYMILVDWYDSYDEAAEERLNYLTSGVDIPHLLQIKTLEGEKKYALLYRYHYDEKKLKNYFSEIKNKMPDAKIIKAKNPKQPVLTQMRYANKL